jgi:hypothetical protein
MSEAEPTGEQLALDVFWDQICAIAVKDKKVPLRDQPGLWEFTAGKWKLTVNPHSYKIGDVDSGTVNVDWNGWPAGIISYYNAQVVHGDEANIFTLVAALKERAAL